MKLDDAARAIVHGSIVAFPTESSWGLAVDALSETALAELFRVKGREPEKPPLVLVDGVAMLQQVVRVIPEKARVWMTRFWPGPLTLVLPARDALPASLVRSGGVGVRHSAHEVATRLVSAVGRPITATSANLAGERPAMSRLEIRATFGGNVEILNEGDAGGAAPSTVVSVDENNQWHILREGPITRIQLEEAHG